MTDDAWSQLPTGRVKLRGDDLPIIDSLTAEIAGEQMINVFAVRAQATPENSQLPPRDPATTLEVVAAFTASADVFLESALLLAQIASAELPDGWRTFAVCPCGSGELFVRCHGREED